MEISGTLHLYSGTDREFFFVFDDEIAQILYSASDFHFDDIESRRVHISVGNDRFISRRTLSFSRKQREIKVSLCKETTKDGLGSLTELYDWFAPVGTDRPKVVSVVGALRKARHEHSTVWELALEEPVDLISPPGLKRRTKDPSKARKAYATRRRIQERELALVGRLAEARALRVLETHFRAPRFSCLWRDGYLDSEKETVRQQGIICDIDVWDNRTDISECFIEVKAQQVRSVRTRPMFYLSSSEWRSLSYAISKKIDYRIWLVQYQDVDQLRDVEGKIRILELREIAANWITPEVLIVSPDFESLRAVEVG